MGSVYLAPEDTRAHDGQGEAGLLDLFSIYLMTYRFRLRINIRLSLNLHWNAPFTLVEATTQAGHR